MFFLKNLFKIYYIHTNKWKTYKNVKILIKLYKNRGDGDEDGDGDGDGELIRTRGFPPKYLKLSDWIYHR